MAKPRRLLLCYKDLGGVMRRACEMGMEIPIIVLGVVEGETAWGFLFVVGCNEADEKSARFRIDAHSLYRAVALSKELGLDIVAIVHNHLRGVPLPSAYDREGMKIWPIVWVIFSCNNGAAAWFPEVDEEKTINVREIELELVENCGLIAHSCPEQSYRVDNVLNAYT